MTYNRDTMESNIVVYYFRVFVGKPLVDEVADILNESLHFRAFADYGTNGNQNRSTVWGTVELPAGHFPHDAFRHATQEVLGYSLGKPQELRKATDAMGDRIRRDKMREREVS